MILNDKSFSAKVGNELTTNSMKVAKEETRTHGRWAENYVTHRISCTNGKRLEESIGPLYFSRNVIKTVKVQNFILLAYISYFLNFKVHVCCSRGFSCRRHAPNQENVRPMIPSFSFLLPLFFFLLFFPSSSLLFGTQHALHLFLSMGSVKM